MNVVEKITIPVRDCEFPQPFPGGLEFNAPARGMWNIVHTGMLLPDAHQIYICARGCLRGVILTAAEMNAMDRMSWVSIEENDFFDSSMEENVVEGVTDILNKLPRKPPVVLVFLSCIQLFAGIDFPSCLAELKSRFPGIEFVDCYMNPTMRKSGLTPDQLMRKQLYFPLKAGKELERKSINLLGSDFPADRSGELFKWLDENDILCREITRCRTYEEYLEMGKSFLNMTWIPQAAAGAEELCRRLEQKHLHLPICYGEEDIEKNYAALAAALDLPVPDFSAERAEAARALKRTLEKIGGTPLFLDYTATPRILSLARRLLENGFNVKRIYADVFIPGDKEDLEVLKKYFPAVEITPTLDVNMRFAAPEERNKNALSIGQKAAFFTGTPHFVDLVWGRGFFGHSGVAAIAGLIDDAFENSKDICEVISHKGWGCESCL